MNRRSRRRAARHAPRRPPRARRRLSPLARLLLALAGGGLIAAGIVLAMQGGSARAGRLLGAIALVGAALCLIAWQGVF